MGLPKFPDSDSESSDRSSLLTRSAWALSNVGCGAFKMIKKSLQFEKGSKKILFHQSLPCY